MIAQTKTIELDKDYTDIPFADYRAWPDISQSVIKQGRVSMLHMLHSMQEDTTPTDAMNLGSATGYAFLEPELLPEKVVLWDGASRNNGVENSNGVKYKQFKKDNAGKIILTKGFHANLKGMLKALREHPEIRAWISRAGDIEVSRVTEIMGVRVKGRVDKLTDDPVIDLKTSSADLDEDRFSNQIIKLGYHIQGPVYCHIFKRERFILGVVASSPPYDVVVFELEPDLLAFGWREAKLLISAWKNCCKKKHWPGRSEGIVTMGLPKWLQDQITSCGLSVKL